MRTHWSARAINFKSYSGHLWLRGLVRGRFLLVGLLVVVKDVLADLRPLIEGDAPVGSGVIGVIPERAIGGIFDLLGSDLLGQALALAPGPPIPGRVGPPVAVPGELAAKTRLLATLHDDLANGIGESTAFDPVHDDVGDGDLAGIGLAAGFVVDVEGEAVKLIAVDLRRNFEGICLGGGEGSDGDDETRCNRLPTTHGTTPNPTTRKLRQNSVSY